MSRRATALIVRTLTAAVVLLHAGFLWQRIGDLSITEPGVIARWSVAAIVAAAALLLLHLRVSRRAWLVFWTIVVLLHAPAPVTAITIAAVAPAILWVIGAIRFQPRRIATLLEIATFIVAIAISTITLPSRAPPLW
ncbi:MAG: hypothetical protein DMF56_01290 [Acidobacteria bacterium]|nr:MAG: hypothetical protein DMF56_01290 [Acidobacteriota bacterium]